MKLNKNKIAIIARRTACALALLIGSTAAFAQSVTLTNLITPQVVNGSVTGAWKAVTFTLPNTWFQDYFGGITNAPNYVTNVVGGVTNISNTITNSAWRYYQLSLDSSNTVPFNGTNYPNSTNPCTVSYPVYGSFTILVRPVAVSTNALTEGSAAQQ